MLVRERITGGWEQTDTAATAGEGWKSRGGGRVPVERGEVRLELEDERLGAPLEQEKDDLGSSSRRRHVERSEAVERLAVRVRATGLRYHKEGCA